MTLWEYYLQYTGEILEGKRPCPPGIEISGEGEEARTLSLLRQAGELGIEEFVRACARADGLEIPQEVYDEFCLEDVQQLLARMPVQAPEADAPKAEAPAEHRNAYEVLLDCCCLDDRLMEYLIEVLKNGDEVGFHRICQVTTRQEIQPGVLLAWMATLEDRAPEEERACAVLMDACFDRLIRNGEMETAAALLAGDQKTFEAFRCEAPELRQVPAATFQWYEQNYLDKHYPTRMLMRANGVAFPKP